MKALGFIVRIIGAMILISLPIIFTSIIFAFISKNDVPNINPTIKHTISIALLIIMIAFSVFYTIVRHNQGEIRSLKEIMHNPNIIFSIILTFFIMIGLMIYEGNIAFKYIVAFTILFVFISYFSLKYMRGIGDFESKYLLGLWSLTLLSLFGIIHLLFGI